MSLLTALLVKDSHDFAEIFINLKNHPRPNLKCIHNLDFGEIPGKQLLSRTIFSSLFNISCSNFRLKLCQRR